MFGLGPATKVYLAVGATDLRKGFDGLEGLARDALGLDPLSGHLVLFCNRACTRLKGLFSRWQWVVALRQAARKGPL
jgi:transposase